MYCIVLYCILHCIALHYTALHYIALYLKFFICWVWHGEDIFEDISWFIVSGVRQIYISSSPPPFVTRRFGQSQNLIMNNHITNHFFNLDWSLSHKQTNKNHTFTTNMRLMQITSAWKITSYSLYCINSDR